MDANKRAIENLANNLFKNHSSFIDYTRQGIPGYILEQAIEEFGHPELFVDLLDVTVDDLNKLYHKKTLPRLYSEGVLDTMRLFYKARIVFGNRKKASQWLDRKVPALENQAPIELCDTFEGRKMVQNTLDRIEYGELVA